MLCLARFGLVMALFVSLGGHWALLQSLAWGRMIVEYSQEGSVKDAVVKTFDGNHPCELCKSLGTARKEKSSDEYLVLKKTEMIHESVAALIFWTGRSENLPVVDWSAATFAAEPLSPPPRVG